MYKKILLKEKMSFFKVYIRRNSNKVVFRDTIENFQEYSDLKDKIFKDSQKTSFLNINENLKEDEKYKLVFGDEIDKSIIPEELRDGIFDEESFSYFKSKMDSCGLNNGKLKLYIEKVDTLPKFKIKGKDEILDENLKKFWELSLNDIISELNANKLMESKNAFDKLNEKNKNNEEILKKIKHNNIICSNCFQKDFSGVRYICTECDNYNLCQECEKILQAKEIHPIEHVFIKSNKNIDDDILKYNNIIGKYQKEFQNVDEKFKFELTLVNNGENDLKNCYILPIKYGEQYLTCEPKKITDEIKRGMKTNISIDVKLPKKIGYFEGYLRMFTPNGIPFGNVIYIKVINGN